jgi:hypothetical protein
MRRRKVACTWATAVSSMPLAGWKITLLAHRQARKDMVGEVSRRLHHALRVARRAYAPAFAREGYKVVVRAVSASCAGKAVGKGFHPLLQH